MEALIIKHLRIKYQNPKTQTELALIFRSKTEMHIISTYTCRTYNNIHNNQHQIMLSSPFLHLLCDIWEIPILMCARIDVSLIRSRITTSTTWLCAPINDKMTEAETEKVQEIIVISTDRQTVVCVVYVKFCNWSERANTDPNTFITGTIKLWTIN